MEALLKKFNCIIVAFMVSASVSCTDPVSLGLMSGIATGLAASVSRDRDRNIATTAATGMSIKDLRAFNSRLTQAKSSFEACVFFERQKLYFADRSVSWISEIGANPNSFRDEKANTTDKETIEKLIIQEASCFNTFMQPLSGEGYPSKKIFLEKSRLFDQHTGLQNYIYRGLERWQVNQAYTEAERTYNAGLNKLENDIFLKKEVTSSRLAAERRAEADEEAARDKRRSDSFDEIMERSNAQKQKRRDSWSNNEPAQLKRGCTLPNGAYSTQC